MEATAAWVGQGGGAFGRLGDSSTFGLPTVSLLTHSVLTAQQSFINLILYYTKLAVSGGKKTQKKTRHHPKNGVFYQTSAPISLHVSWMDPAHSGPKAQLQSCIFWLVCPAPRRGWLCVPAAAPESRFCRGWAR